MSTYIAKSKIHGKGVFAKDNIKSGGGIGVAVLDINPLKRTEIGRLINHSDNASSVLRENGNVFSLFASKDIKEGEEITVDYYQAEEELGIPIDTSFLKEDLDGGTRDVRACSCASNGSRGRCDSNVFRKQTGNRSSRPMEKTYPKVKLSKREDPFDFEVLEPLTDEVEVPSAGAHSEEETAETDTAANIGKDVPLAKKREAPKPVPPVLEEVIEPLDWSVEELEEALREFEAAKRRPLLSKHARRRGVKEEHVWMYVDGKLYVEKNVDNEKELIGVGHINLANKAGVSPTHEYPRGFVTAYENGEIEVQTYGMSFWEMPSRVQDRVERWFELTPGQYKVEAPLALPPGAKLKM